MPFFRRESIRASLQRMLLLALPVFILFGCLNYDEQSTLRANGSGEIRLLNGFPKEGASSVTLDTDKAETIRQAIDSEPGLKVLSKLDSNTAQIRWFGYVLHFDSLTALSPLQNRSCG
jgi:hypothetical protein